MPNIARSWAALGLFIACAATPNLALAKPKGKTGAKVASATVESNRCDRFSQKTDKANRSVTFRITNVCRADALRCTVSWKVSCATDKDEARSERIEPGQTQSFESTARGCAEDESWAISPPEWSCDVISTSTA